MRLTISALMIGLLIFLVSCGTGKLTKEKAQRTLDRWKNDTAVKGIEPNRPVSSTAAGGSETPSELVVEGVQETQQDNSAKVHLTFNNFEYGSGKYTYSGTGVATFSHYNDGRWVLIKVETSQKVWEGKQVKYGGKEDVVIE